MPSRCSASSMQGMSATDAGMLMMPAGIIVAFALPFTGRLADRSKPHYIIICGLFFFFSVLHCWVAPMLIRLIGMLLSLGWSAVSG